MKYALGIKHRAVPACVVLTFALLIGQQAGHKCNPYSNRMALRESHGIKQKRRIKAVT
jgi:hypothetical protein